MNIKTVLLFKVSTYFLKNECFVPKMIKILYFDCWHENSNIILIMYNALVPSFVILKLFKKKEGCWPMASKTVLGSSTRCVGGIG